MLEVLRPQGLPAHVMHGANPPCWHQASLTSAKGAYASWRCSTRQRNLMASILGLSRLEWSSEHHGHDAGHGGAGGRQRLR